MLLLVLFRLFGKEIANYLLRRKYSLESSFLGISFVT